MVQKSSRLKEINHHILDKILITTITDINGVIIDASKGFETLSGYTKEELIGNTHKIMSHPDTPSEMFEAMWKTITQGKSWSGELKNKNKAGDEYWSQMHIEPILENNQTLGYLAIRTNITEHKKLLRQSTIDPLTGILNRAQLDHILKQEVSHSSKTDTPFSCIFFDVDNFKTINDRYGHLEGDRILTELTRNLSGMLRSSDFFGRWGGEEFMIITPKTSAEAAYHLAEKLRLHTYHHDFKLTRPVTISIGISQFHPSQTIPELIAVADQAMYTAKKQGKNQVVINHGTERF